ncbi:MAG: hypothetical protein NTU91_04035 [Chloroflexi bacterium]|nr:hypothetical protein [Chloroflexota bacterium]
MSVRWLPAISLVAVVILELAGCASAPETNEPTSVPAVPTNAASDQPTSTAESTLDPYPGWTTYANESIGLSFRYPSTWFGPGVYEFEDGIRLAVGSDVVYPYGTSLEDRQPGAPNAYGVVIQYTVNRAGWTLEQYRAEQPWFDDYLAVLDMQDGESSTTARSLTMRERSLTVGRFTGVEFITTLSETAQTERFYMRTAFLMDENLNVLQIAGSPENVEITDPANWRAAFESIDGANLATFRTLVESIQVE